MAFTSLSEKSLIYYDGDFAHKIFSMGEASATDEQDFQDYLLRELMSEGRIRHSTVQKVGNELIATTIEKQGPVAFLVTTTKNKLHPENETRMLSLEIDDSEKQTKSVLDKVAQVEGLNQSTAQIDYKPWHDYQRWLEQGPRRVVLPYAAILAELIPAASVRLRRDIGQVIRAIKAHALLHREQRERDNEGQIIADIEHDYEAVRPLLNSILAEGSGVAVSPATIQTIDAVQTATAKLLETEGASAQDIANILKLDKSAAWRRLTAARQEGFIVNLEQRRGMPGKYRTTSQKVELVVILPTSEKLLERFAKACSLVPTQKPVQPCNRDEKADIFLEDDGCAAGCNPVAGCEPMQTVAKSLATVNSLKGNAKSPPVARFHENRGGYEDNVGISHQHKCSECRKWGATLEVHYGDAGPFWLHPDCVAEWRAGDIPAFLDRRDEVRADDRRLSSVGGQS